MTTILIAGIYRSGSTWLFNAVRLLAQEAHEEIESGFIWNSRRNPKAKIRVIKTHYYYEDEELGFTPDYVVTSVRSRAEIVESMKKQRAKGLEPQFKNAGNFEEIDTFLAWLELWEKHPSHVYQMDYDEIYFSKLAILRELNRALRLNLKPSQISNVLKALSEMKSPSKGFDPITLLTSTHPNK